MSDTGSELPKVAVADDVADEAAVAVVEVENKVNDDAAEPPQPIKDDSVVLTDVDVGDQSVAEADQIITLEDVLDEQKAMNLEYAAVLGGSDHKSCTYATVSALILGNG